jgi:hypothetical protein
MKLNLPTTAFVFPGQGSQTIGMGKDLAEQYPTLCSIASQIPTSLGLVDGITRTISERGEILDSASETLAAIRRDLRIAHDRLMTKLQRMVSDPHTSPYLQEALITQRDGRYVLPLRAGPRLPQRAMPAPHSTPRSPGRTSHRVRPATPRVPSTPPSSDDETAARR